ncbi:MAG: HAD family hydrolase [Dehalococcoidia bacterium]
MTTPVVLWDIDQTLIRTAGAGREAMGLAFEEIYGLPDAFANVEFSGRTDFAIFWDALGHRGMDKDDFSGQLDRFRALYVQRLEAILPHKDGHILPGVSQVISRLADLGAAQGVATGNFKGGAELKLRRYGLDRWLNGGGYGDNSADRADVVAEGAADVRRAHGLNGACEVYVIGDTPFDVEAARANGFKVIAVATGRHDVATLAGCSPDATLLDLRDTNRVVGLIGNLSPNPSPGRARGTGASAS